MRNTDGDVSINDGSGSISVTNTAGVVTVDDGSGSVKLNDIRSRQGSTY